jgi:hypothetical protein
MSIKLPQFTLRDLLWLVLVVGLSLALWRERRERQALEYDAWQWKAENLAARWRQFGGDVQWVDSGNGNGWGAIYTDPEGK